MPGGKKKRTGGSPQAEQTSPTKQPQAQQPQAGSSTSGDVPPQQATRPRGGYRTAELNTIPSNVTVVRVDAKGRQGQGGRALSALSNFVEIIPMKERQVYKYRVDFSPDIESAPDRRRAFRLATEGILPRVTTAFDGGNDARSSVLVQKGFEKKVAATSGAVLVKAKFVGPVPWNSFELLRMYNINTNEFLKKLGFFRMLPTGGHVHPSLRTELTPEIFMLRGFRTAINAYDRDKILMNMEPYHKLVQAHNVLQLMSQFGGRPNMEENIRSALVGRTVATNYGKITYQIEDVHFDLSPKSTFLDKATQKQVSYMDYYKRKYSITIKDTSQFLMSAVETGKRKRSAEDEEVKLCNLVPELCNLSGLTAEQRTDNRLKTILLQSSQVEPAERVQHMHKFLSTFHSSNDVAEILRGWGYNYADRPVEVQAYQMATEKIGIGRAAQNDKKTWPPVDANTASFEHLLTKDSILAAQPGGVKLAILITRNDQRDRPTILQTLRRGFERIGLQSSPEVIDMPEGDLPQHFVNRLRNISNDTNATMVIMTRQNKERYNAIKKLASVERGLITQVVTARLLTDQRKAAGAALKIGVQVAAKVGGEPWYVNLPLKGAMFCGYDTYHDTAKRGRSFGAFVASVNDKYSRWFSRADAHDRPEELSAQITTNMRLALKRYHEVNKAYPQMIFLYRDGVSDGQLDQVYNVELQDLLKAIKKVNGNIKVTVIVVNKRIGARFYMRSGNGFTNLPPGSVVDDIVTRKERYDFYLISQSTRKGTVTPTYYNIIHDESGFGPHIHQAMAYKLTMLYYNWTGTVRVPAPCQYAHKLALLCGEHLHQSPHTALDDRLHFL